ncbi:MAG: hypothetical protein ACRDGV_08960 [Candidatus Limnocylindria bacterium]
MTLSGCNGGVVIEWSKVLDARFNHYTTLRSTSSNMAGAVEVAGTYTTDAAKTSAVDATGALHTTYHYRVMAFDASDQVIAASSVQSAKAKPIHDLSELTAAPAGGAETTFTWAAYPGPGSCFSYYKLVYSDTDPAPSYLDGDPNWAAVAEQSATSVTVDGPVSGETYYIRLQAIRATALGSFVVAQTDVLEYTAP